MKNTILCLFVATASFLFQGCATHKISVRDSFVQVLKTVEVSGCGLDAEEQSKEKCATFVELSGVGSGAVVWNERTIGGQPRTLVLTADHVCYDRNKVSKENVPPMVIKMFKERNGITGDLKFVISKIDIKLRDSRGKLFNTNQEPWVRNVEADLCVIESSINQRAVPISRGMVEFGERTTNISAPYGLMFTSPEGGAVYVTEGLYSGRLSMQDGVRDMYTIWVAPGSSGSPIINKQGEIVGVVSAISTVTWARMAPRGVGVISAPSNITFSPTLKDVQFTVSEAIAALKRGKPYVHSVQSATSSEPSDTGTNIEGETGDQNVLPDMGGHEFIFPYEYEWR